MKIGDLTRKHQVSHRQIRHYEQLGLLQSSREPSSNYRVYDARACDRLEIIKLLRGFDFSLAEIGAILESPQGRATRELFRQKSATLSRDISALKNRSQILEAAARALERGGAKALSLAEIIRECAYISSKNEGMIPVTNDKIIIEIGAGLIPTADSTHDAALIGAVKEVRTRLESELAITIPPVRIRDVPELPELAARICISGREVCRRAYAACRGAETADDISRLLEACVRDNADAFR